MAKRILDKETCRKICARYPSKGALLHGDPALKLPPDPAVHHKCYKEGWLDEFFIDQRHNKESRFTFEYCRDLASHCANRADFAKQVGCRYSKILADGWVDKFAKEFHWMTKSESMSNRLRKYSDEDIRCAAQKFTKLCDFRARDNIMYNRARIRKLLPQFTWLQRNDGVKDCFADNIYVYEFSDSKVVYIGRTVNPIQRDKDHHKSGDSVYDYANAAGVPIPTVKYLYKNITVDAGKQLEDAVINQYKSTGWILLNKMKGGGCGNLYRISKSQLLKTAGKYEFFRDFYLNDRAAYVALDKYGWLSECSWLKYINGRPGEWDDYDKCKKEAEKYKGRDAFRIGSSTAFKTAWRNGWIEEWFPIKLNRGVEIEQYDIKTGAVIAIFESTNIASRKLSIQRSLIQACCHGRNQSAGGYGFRFHCNECRPSDEQREIARIERNAKQRERIKQLKLLGWVRVTDPITKKRKWVAPKSKD